MSAERAEAERLADSLRQHWNDRSIPTWQTIREASETIARLQQERNDADGLAKSHEEEIEHLQSSIQSLRAEYRLCRERLMVLADAAVERDTATREAEALREEEVGRLQTQVANLQHGNYLHAMSLRRSLSDPRQRVTVSTAPAQPSADDAPSVDTCLDSLKRWSEARASADAVEQARDCPDPTMQMLNDPIFNAIWSAIKTWDVNVPYAYVGYCGATGGHARAVFDAIKPFLEDERAAAHARGRAEMRDAILAYHETRRLECTELATAGTGKNGIAGAHVAAHAESIDAIRALPDAGSVRAEEKP